MNTVRLLAFAVAALVLAACSTVGVPSGPASRGLDPLHDDVASLVVAFDLPAGLGPAKGSLFTFDVGNGGPQEHLRLLLVLADLDAVPSALPPPGQGRAYYLFSFAEPDKAAIRAAQAAANARAVSADGVRLGVIPKLCSSGALDPNQVTVSVLAALPNQNGLARFVDHQLLAQLLQQPGSTQMPACL